MTTSSKDRFSLNPLCKSWNFSNPQIQNCSMAAHLSMKSNLIMYMEATTSKKPLSLLQGRSINWKVSIVTNCFWFSFTTLIMLLTNIPIKRCKRHYQRISVHWQSLSTLTWRDWSRTYTRITRSFISTNKTWPINASQ